MLSLEEGSQISVYVQQTVIAWVQLYPSFQNTKQLVQLTNGNFFLLVLQSLPNFKLLSPIFQLNGDQNLAAKVNIIKNISKSLIKFHQTQLLRDVSQLDINYVQLCMGNKKQLFRLITMLLSALCSQKLSRQAIEQKLQQMQQQKAEVMKIMIQNSLNIGQQCGSCSSRSWKLSEQKKVFAKMQILQNKIQQLQIINKGLEQKIKSQKQAQQISLHENRKLKQQIRKILLINDQLVQSNQKAANQLKLSNIEQTSAKKKFQLMRNKLQDKIAKLTQERQKLFTQKYQLLGSLERLGKVGEINQQIKQQNQLLRQSVRKLQQQKVQLKKIQKVHNQQFLALKRHCSELQIKIQELSLACNNSSKSNFSQNNYRTCYFGNRMQDEENMYRVKQNLNWLNNQDSYKIQLENSSLKMNKNNEENSFKDNNKFEIRTITQRSIEDSICLSHIKQNQSIIMNNSQIFAIKGNSINSMDKTSQSIHKQSNKNVQMQKMEERYQEQIRLLTSVIIDLQTQLDQARKRSHSIYFDNNSLTFSRMEKFKHKVKEMFGEDPKNMAIR